MIIRLNSSTETILYFLTSLIYNKYNKYNKYGSISYQAMSALHKKVTSTLQCFIFSTIKGFLIIRQKNGKKVILITYPNHLNLKYNQMA